MPSVPFRGDTIRTGESIPPFALMRLARAAKTGVDVNSIEGLSALYEVFELFIVPEDWGRFQVAAMRATGEDLLAFLTAARDAIQAEEKPAPAVSAEPVPVPSAPLWN